MMFLAKYEPIPTCKIFSIKNRNIFLSTSYRGPFRKIRIEFQVCASLKFSFFTVNFKPKLEKETVLE